MAFTFNIFADAGLTVLAPNPLVFTFPEDAPPAVYEKQQLWIGSPDISRKIVDKAAPGVVNVEITLETSTGLTPNPQPPDAGLSLDDVLYVTPTLDLGVTEVLGGVGNAIEFWVRTEIFAGATPGNYTNVSFFTQTVEEIDV